EAVAQALDRAADARLVRRTVRGELAISHRLLWEWAIRSATSRLAQRPMPLAAPLLRALRDARTIEVLRHWAKTTEMSVPEPEAIATLLIAVWRDAREEQGPVREELLRTIFAVLDRVKPLDAGPWIIQLREDFPIMSRSERIAMCAWAFGH